MYEEAQILKWLGQSPKSSAPLIDITRSGIDSTVAKQVLERFRLNANQTHAILGTSARTLARRLQKKQPLDSVESDRLVRFLNIVAYADTVFEEHTRTLRWLNSPNRALGGKIPMDLLDTDVGTQQVEEILHRIDYSLYS